MNPTFKRWLICILLLILFMGLAHVRAADAIPAPGNSSAGVAIPILAVSKTAESSVKKTAIQSQAKTGLKLAPLQIVQVELGHRDVSEPIWLQPAEPGNSHRENFSKSSQKGGSESAGARVWVFLCWPGACFLGE